MFRLALALAAAIALGGCAAHPGGGPPVARTTSSPSAIGAAPPSAAASPSPVSSPAPQRDAILVFVRPGAVSLVRPDGTGISTMSTMTLDGGEVAQSQYFTSDGALIGHYWDADGNPTSPLAVALLDRAGTITALAPGAAKYIADNGPWGSPIVIGHFMFRAQATFEKADYIRLDLTTGKLIVLLTATGLPRTGQQDGPPPLVEMTTLGTTADGSVARVMVSHVVVNGQSIDGKAYFEIDLGSDQATGPHLLPNLGPFGMSADGRFIGWWEVAPVSGSSQKDLHVRDLSSGQEWIAPSEPFQNEAQHGGVRFSPDDRYVLIEGYGADSRMGFAVYDMPSHALVRSILANEPNEPLADVPLWWTDSHTLVYKTVDPSGAASGHRFDIATGAITGYPADLGAPVLMLG